MYTLLEGGPENNEQWSSYWEKTNGRNGPHIKQHSTLTTTEYLH